MAPSKTLHTGLDVGKFLAALLVLTLHTRPLAQNPAGDFWLGCLCRIAVPFFFVASSYLFYTGKGDIKRYVTRILILYAVWFVLEAPMTYYRFFVEPDGSLFRNLVLFFRGLLLNSTFYASWYLTASWQGMLIVWWLSKRISPKWLTVIGIVCFLASLPGTMWYGLIANTPFRQPYWLFNMALCPANSFIIAIPYCILGKYLAEGKIEPTRQQGALLLLGAVAFSILEIWICRNTFWMTDTYLGLLFLAPILVWWMLQARFGISDKVSKCLRNCSTLVYLSHLPFRFLFLHLNVGYGWKLFLLTLAASLVFSVIIWLLSLRLRPLKYLY